MKRRASWQGIIAGVTWLMTATAGASWQAGVAPPAPPGNCNHTATGPENRSVTGRLPAGTHQALFIELSAEEFLALSVRGRGAPIGVEVLGPGGEVVARDPHLDGDPTILSVISREAGVHEVRVTAGPAGSQPAAFELRIEERRPARPADAARIAAERACLEAEELRKQWTSDADKAAFRLFRQALAHAGRSNDPATLARVHLGAGDLAMDRSRRPEARRHYDEALRLSGEKNDLRGIGNALARLGLVQVLDGRSECALETLRGAVEACEISGDDRCAALALANTGEAFYFLGRQREAATLYQESADLCAALGDESGLAQAEHYLASAFSDLSRVGEAFSRFERSVQLWRRVGDRHGEVRALTHLAALHGRLGEKQEAIRGYRDVEEMFRKGGADPLGHAMAMNGLGYNYQTLGDAELALQYYREALRLYREAGFTEGIAGQLMRVGEAQHRQGDYAGALESLGRALEGFRDIGDERMQAGVLRVMGAVHRDSGNAALAADRLREALRLSRASDDARNESSVLIELGLAHRDLGNAASCAELFGQALEVTRRSQDPFGEVQSRYYLAQQRNRAGEAAEARALAGESIRIIESLRTRVDAPRLRMSYFSTIRRNYDLYADLLMQAGRAGSDPGLEEAAFEVSERARARTLLEMLGEARSGIRRGIDPALADREKELRRSLSALALQHSQATSGRSSREAELLAAEIRLANAEYDRLQAEIRSGYRHYAALTQPEPLTASQIREQVLDDDTLLLEYSLGEERSYAWVLSKSSLASFELPARAEVEKLARETREVLTARQRERSRGSTAEVEARARAADARYWRSAAALSRILLGPVAGRAAGKRLLVVPDGALQYIPFAALPEPGRAGPPRPLIATHEIVTLPSASTLALIRRETSERRPGRGGVAVLADPVFEPDDPRLDRAGAGTIGGSSLPRLLHSLREAEEILSLAPPGPVARWIGFDASRSRALSDELRTYGTIHFATHSVTNDQHPDLSFVALSMYGPDGRPVEGHLRLLDVFNLDISAELVVLSACDTALGRDVRGEGLVGLVRGFMYAGAARVVASLWKADDAATAELMRRFYAAMFGSGLTPAAALRAAQVELSGHPRWSAPFYWAGFVLQGEYL